MNKIEQFNADFNIFEAIKKRVLESLRKDETYKQWVGSKHEVISEIVTDAMGVIVILKDEEYYTLLYFMRRTDNPNLWNVSGDVTDGTLEQIMEHIKLRTKA